MDTEQKGRIMGRPLKFQDPAAFALRVDAYFVYCDQNEKPYTISGLAAFLETSRETLLEYTERADFVDTIKRAKVKCEAFAEEYLYSGKQVAGAIFSMKNNYGWVDKTESDVGVHGDMTVQAMAYGAVQPAIDANAQAHNN